MTVQVPAKRDYVLSDPRGQIPHGQPAVSPEHLLQQQSFINVYPYQRAGITASQNLPAPLSSDSQDKKRRRLNDTTAYLSARHGANPETMYPLSHPPVHNVAYTLPQQHASQIPMRYVQGTQDTRPAIVSPPQAVYPQSLQPPAPWPPAAMISRTPTKVGSSQPENPGVAAVVMSIPVLDKIKLLSRISRPLLTPGITSMKFESRGAIIAIEGMDAKSVNSMTGFLTKQLQREGKFAVRIFDAPDLYSGGCASHSRGEVTPETYLKTLSEWHKINKEMVEYITTGPGYGLQKTVSVVSGSESLPILIDDDGQYQMSEDDGTIKPEKIVQIHGRSETSSEMLESTHSAEDDIAAIHGAGRLTSGFTQPIDLTRTQPPSSTPPPASPPSPPASRIPSHSPINNSPRSSNTQATATWTRQHPGESEPVRPSGQAIPIALVPRFELTTVDTWSTLMPISDGFSPAAHWEWFARLWRGIVGPDLTIVIQGLDDERAVGGAARTRNDSPAPSFGDARDQRSNAGAMPPGPRSGVKNRLCDYRTMIVRTGLVSSTLSLSPEAAADADTDGKTTNATSSALEDPAQQARDMKNWEKAKRRVGFEVEEFLRR